MTPFISGKSLPPLTADALASTPAAIDKKTMTITLNESTLSAANALGSSQFESKNTQKNTGESSPFGDLMSGLWQPAHPAPSTPTVENALVQDIEGQALADLGSMTLNLPIQTNTSALMAFTLGPHLNVITAESPAPDSQSLEAFARSQGLDEQAVQWLFGAPTAAVSNTPTTMLGTQSTLHQTQVSPENLLERAADSLVAQGLINTTNPAPTPATVSFPVPVSDNTMAGEKDPVMALLLAGAHAIERMSDASGPTKTPVATQHATNGPEDGVAMHLLRMPPPATVWVQRNAMTAMTENPSHKAAEISITELDMGADWATEMMNHLQTEEGSAPNGASTTGTHGAGYANFAARWDAMANLKADSGQAAAMAPSESAARNENIQNLADKMGYAIGQRILSEMEKGQWHLKLQLRPATLGHIEVEMKMRSGEFDAVFTAPNSLTRDLLQDGMAKLKDTLSQMGMDVASIHVQDGQTGQRGGDSTPGAFRGQAKEEASKSVADEMPPLQPVKKITDGLDILV